MNNNSNTGIIVGALIAAVLVVGGIFWLMTNNSDDDTAMPNNTEQSQPATQPAAEQPQDIVTLASGQESSSTLVTAVQAADLVESLKGEGPFTVLAPNNDAFAALPDGTLDSLLESENKDQLAAVLTYHVIAGNVMSSDLNDGQEVETVQGETLTVEIRDGSVYFVDATGGEAMVLTADVEASNGVVHIIDSVLLPQ